MQTAKEHVTRPLEPDELELIDSAVSCMEHSYMGIQRHLELLHGLKDSSKDYRTQAVNRWRLLPLIPQLGLQVCDFVWFIY